MAIALLCLCIAVAAVYLTAAPFFGPDETPEIDRDLAVRELILRRAKLLQSMKDLDLDYATRKIEQEEYLLQKNALTGELALVYARLDEAPPAGA